MFIITTHKNLGKLIRASLKVLTSISANDNSDESGELVSPKKRPRKDNALNIKDRISVLGI